MSAPSHPAIVVGAGPAGLATSRELKRRGVAHVVLERGEGVGQMWRGLYDSLRLHTGKHMSSLPGMALPASVPLFPRREEFVSYLESYTETFRLPIRTSCAVVGVERAPDQLRVRTSREELTTHALVVATGILSNPVLPELEGRERFRGTVSHSVTYRRPEPFEGRRVLVVGVGNSGGEIGSELARAGVKVTLAVRSGAVVLPRQVLGVPIQYYSRLMAWLPRRGQRLVLAATGWASSLLRGRPVLPRPPFSACPDVPLIGFELIEAIRAGRVSVRAAIAAFTPEGVRFADGSEEPFDDVILATGYRAALGPFEGVVHTDDCGFGRRRQRVRSVDEPRVFFVGHNYDARGGLFNIAQDAGKAAAMVAAALR
jgi:cation diffusion facilitator CzcD-associated flavoprotein CzcO